MTLFHLWDLPGDVLAAPESASGLDRCISLSLRPRDSPSLPDRVLSNNSAGRKKKGEVSQPMQVYEADADINVA